MGVSNSCCLGVDGVIGSPRSSGVNQQRADSIDDSSLCSGSRTGRVSGNSKAAKHVSGNGTCATGSDAGGGRSASFMAARSRRSLDASISRSRNQSAVHTQAELAALVDSQGVLKHEVGRRLSYLSSASVSLSTKGKIMVVPDDGSDPFLLMRLIGAGSVGKVYEGQYDGHKVAVKVWTAEAADNTSNQREERQQQLEGLLLSLMEHANIIKTYKVCTEQQEPDDKDSSASGMGLERESTKMLESRTYRMFIVMELCPLGSLWSALLRGKLHLKSTAPGAVAEASTNILPIATAPHTDTSAAIDNESSALNTPDSEQAAATPTANRVATNKRITFEDPGHSFNATSPKPGHDKDAHHAGSGAAGPPASLTHCATLPHASPAGSHLQHDGAELNLARSLQKKLAVSFSTTRAVPAAAINPAHTPSGLQSPHSPAGGVLKDASKSGDAAVPRWDAWGALETLKEVASALVYMHERNIVHGDLKSANVLLRESTQDRRGFIAKVADLGFARVLPPRDPVRTRTFATVTHMPPELLLDGQLSIAADIYAFGVLMWEVFTAQAVFGDLSDAEVLRAVAIKRARPPVPTNMPTPYRVLMQRCWSSAPDMRPTAPQLLGDLEHLQRMLCPEGERSAATAVPIGGCPAHRRMSLKLSRPINSSLGGSPLGSPGNVGRHNGSPNGNDDSAAGYITPGQVGGTGQDKTIPRQQSLLRQRSQSLMGDSNSQLVVDAPQSQLYTSSSAMCTQQALQPSRPPPVAAPKPSCTLSANNTTDAPAAKHGVVHGGVHAGLLRSMSRPRPNSIDVPTHHFPSGTTTSQASANGGSITPRFFKLSLGISPHPGAVAPVEAYPNHSQQPAACTGITSGMFASEGAGCGRVPSLTTNASAGSSGVTAASAAGHGAMYDTGHADQYPPEPSVAWASLGLPKLNLQGGGVHNNAGVASTSAGAAHVHGQQQQRGTDQAAHAAAGDATPGAPRGLRPVAREPLASARAIDVAGAAAKVLARQNSLLGMDGDADNGNGNEVQSLHGSQYADSVGPSLPTSAAHTHVGVIPAGTGNGAAAGADAASHSRTSDDSAIGASDGPVQRHGVSPSQASFTRQLTAGLAGAVRGAMVSVSLKSCVKPSATDILSAEEQAAVVAHVGGEHHHRHPQHGHELGQQHHHHHTGEHSNKNLAEMSNGLYGRQESGAPSTTGQ